VQTDESDKITGKLQFSGPKPPTSLLNQRFAAIGYGIAFAARERSWKKFHDSGITVQPRKGLTISRLPLP
jgi:hypothetical protein